MDNTEHKKMMEAMMKPPSFKQPKTSKEEKKRLAEAKKRLDEKYIKKPFQYKSEKKAKARAEGRYNERTWKGWRDTDGKKHPVTSSGEAKEETESK